MAGDHAAGRRAGKEFQLVAEIGTLVVAGGGMSVDAAGAAGLAAAMAAGVLLVKELWSAWAWIVIESHFTGCFITSFMFLLWFVLGHLEFPSRSDSS